MAKVLVVGSAENGGGGITTVIKLIKKMPVWRKYGCKWLETQIQAGKAKKAYYAFRSYIVALFSIWSYDIVHFHTVPNISMVVQLPIFLMALVGRKKIILHLHVGNQLEREKEQNFKLFRWCMKKSDVIVLLAKKYIDVIKKNYAEICTPATVIYNACENVNALPYVEHDKTILFAGIFSHNKAADKLILAFAKLHDKYPDWKLQLLGSGPDERAYRDLIAKYGLESCVQIPGYVTGEKKASFFRKAGIYAMCSYLEGFPMVVLEAWAYGVPVVTTPVGGLPDVLEDGKNACVFDFGDIEGLSAQLDKLMGDDNLRVEMGSYAKEMVEQVFSPIVISEQIDVLYTQLLKSKYAKVSNR